MAMLYTLADKFLEGKDLEEAIKNIIEDSLFSRYCLLSARSNEAYEFGKTIYKK